MRFSTIAAVSAIVLGVHAIANPEVVVYETQVVTITSCPPEKPACPASSTTYIPVVTPTPTPEVPEVTPTPAPTPEVPAHEEPVHEEPVHEAPVYGNHTTPAVTPVPEVTEPETETPAVEEKPSPVHPVYPIATGTGVPTVPANTSVPVVPTSPPAFEGAGSKMGVSILAIAGAAVFALMA